MKKLGIGIILLGLVLIANSSLMSITGYVIDESVRVGGSIFGLVFVVVGIGLFFSQKAGGLEKTLKIIRTEQFERAIKRVPKKIIENALAKLGTGKGNEEYIKEGPYGGYWSIRASKGARIYYSLEGDTAKVMAYEPSSRHD